MNLANYDPNKTQRLRFDIYVDKDFQIARPISTNKQTPPISQNRGKSFQARTRITSINQSINKKTKLSPTQQQLIYKIINPLINPLLLSQNQQQNKKYFQQVQTKQNIFALNNSANLNNIRKRTYQKTKITQPSDAKDVKKVEQIAQSQVVIQLNQSNDHYNDNSDDNIDDQQQQLQLAIKLSLNNLPQKNLPPINRQSFVGIKQENNPLKKAKQELQKLLISDQQHQKYHSILMEIQQCSNIQQITEILINYCKRKTAQTLAHKFYYSLGKDKISLSKIQMFYEILRKKKLPGQDINIIRIFIQNGKKTRILQFLSQKLGVYDGKKIFNQYKSQFPQFHSQPLPNSTKLKQIEGLDIYQYSQSHISMIQKNNAKTLIVLGQTGCGKSTFLNSLTNYLAGIQLEDPFRYYIIVQDTANQLEGVTQNISIYYIKDIRTGICYRVIDTPGFGDTKGLNRDEQIVKQISQLFKTKIDSIHLVLFLVKSSTTRLTIYHRYIFQSVMDLFDTTIAQNFVFVLTFSDALSSVALEGIKNKVHGFGAYWDQLKQPKTIQVNNSGFFQKNDPNKDVIRQFWKLGNDFLFRLISKAQFISPKSLNTTKDLIRRKENLSLQIKQMSQKLQNHLAQQQNIREELEKFIEYQDEMKKNEKFQIELNQQQYYGQDTKFNVTRCNNMTCINSNCHENCYYGDGQEKKSCTSMDQNGNCTICPGKCHYLAHTNSHTVRKFRTVKRMTTNQQIKAKYNDAKGKASWYQNSLNKMLQNYLISSKQTKQNLKNMAQLQKKLLQISLSKIKPLTTMQYIQYLIDTEETQRKSGYKKRVQKYKLSLKQLQTQNNTVTGKAFQNIQKQKQQLLKKFHKQRKANKSNMMINFLNFLW